MAHQSFELTSKDIDLNNLAEHIRKEDKPLHLNQLSKLALCTWLENYYKVRGYSPKLHYSIGEKIYYQNSIAQVKSVQAGGNPAQGQFSILTLQMPAGPDLYITSQANITEPVAETQPPKIDLDQKVNEYLSGKQGIKTRNLVKSALESDGRFVFFSDAQGYQCCLLETLPKITDHELSQVWSLLQANPGANRFMPVSTENLLKTIWNLDNDGSAQYLLHEFALNTTLQQFSDLVCLANGWILETYWREFQNRPPLVAPRQPNLITLPSGLTLDNSTESQEDNSNGATTTSNGNQPETIEDDFEAWQQNRLLNATFTLDPKHYYGSWLPLNQSMRKIFPPLETQKYEVTFHHLFGDTPNTFQALVDYEQKKIFGFQDTMYSALADNAIYPGAELIVSHRSNFWEYDIRTKPTTKQGTIKIRRIFLTSDENGNQILDMETVEEPRRYEIKDNVFIAAAAWEDLPALFAEADKVGAGFFKLMYERCCEWWEKRKRQPLYFSYQELFNAVHFGQRMITSEATIRWELWRRLAFEFKGNDTYLFRPERLDQIHSIDPRPAIPPANPKTPSQKVRPSQSLKQIYQKITPPAPQPATILVGSVTPNPIISTSIPRYYEPLQRDFAFIISKKGIDGNKPIQPLSDRLERTLQNSQVVRNYPNLKVLASISLPNWLTVPWIGFFDHRETLSPEKGVYCALLFSADMSGFYLTYQQGVKNDKVISNIFNQGDETKLFKLLDLQAEQIRKRSNRLTEFGFQLDSNIDIKTNNWWNYPYQYSTIAYKFYPITALPSDKAFYQDLSAVLTEYAKYIETKTPQPTNLPSTWIFQVNPKIYNLPGALSKLSNINFEVNQFSNPIQIGDKILLWESGFNAGIIATATVQTEPAYLPENPLEKEFYRDEVNFGETKLRVNIRFDAILQNRLSKLDLQEHPILKSLTILRIPFGTNFSLTTEQAEALNQLISDSPLVLLPSNSSQTLTEATNDAFSGTDISTTVANNSTKAVLPNPDVSIPLPSNNPIQKDFAFILSNYLNIKTVTPFGSSNPIKPVFDRLELAFQNSQVVRSYPNLKVIASIGKGNWANVPWIAFLDDRETNTTQKGVYCVLLFRADMSGFYLTYQQGITDILEAHDRTEAYKILRQRAAQIRPLTTGLTQFGFLFDNNIDLKTDGWRGVAYEHSTIAYKYYSLSSLPYDDAFYNDLSAALTEYAKYIRTKAGSSTRLSSAWIFQANPKIYDLQGALTKLSSITYEVNQFANQIHIGDKIFLWESGSNAGIIATATVLTEPSLLPENPKESVFYLDKTRFEETKLRVRIRFNKVLQNRLTKATFQQHPVLNSLTILRAPFGTNFQVTLEQAQALDQLISGSSSTLLSSTSSQPVATVNDSALSSTSSSQPANTITDDSFWLKIKSLIYQSLRTPSQNTQFHIYQITETFLRFEKDTGEKVFLERFRLEKAWTLLKSNGQLDLPTIKKECSILNYEFIAAIIAAIRSNVHTDTNMPSSKANISTAELEVAFVLGLLLGRGEIHRVSRTVGITLQYGSYTAGKISGGGQFFEERVALPGGAKELYERLDKLKGSFSSLSDVTLQQKSIYRYEVILQFNSSRDLFNTIVLWYPTGHSYHDFVFPRNKLLTQSKDFCKAYMQGYACATGLITDATRAGTAGKHRVYLRASKENKDLLNDIKWLLEEKLKVQIAGIHWHDGRDPQLRVYAENFEEIGFGMSWKDAILAACAKENRLKEHPDYQLQLF